MLTIRAALASDVPTIAEIHEICWRAAYKFMPDEVLNTRNKEFRQRQWEDWFRDNKAENNEGLFVFEQNNKTIGFCMCKPNQDDVLIGARGEIHALYVLPEARTFGVSYLAANTLSKYLLERDLAPICCWAFQKNRIWRWYERLGFKRIVARNRRINNIDIPEYGLVHFEPNKLIDFTSQHLEHAA